MSNSYYVVSGTPGTGSPGASAPVRGEFALIAAGFNLLPALSVAAAGCAVVLNGSGTALVATTGALTLAGNFTTTGAYNLTLAQQGNVTLTLPAATDTLVGRATTDTLTNKTLTAPTLTAPVLGTPASGTLTNCTSLPISGISGLGTGVGTLLGGSTSGTGGPAGTINPTFTGTITGPDSATWTSGGLASLVALGIGMSPTNILDITQNHNASSIVSILNNSAGGSASSYLQASNGTQIAEFGQLGTGFTTAGIYQAGRAFIKSTGALAIGSGGIIAFGVNNSSAQVAAFGTDGSFSTNGPIVLNSAAAAQAVIHSVLNTLVASNGTLTLNIASYSGGGSGIIMVSSVRAGNANVRTNTQYGISWRQSTIDGITTLNSAVAGGGQAFTLAMSGVAQFTVTNNDANNSYLSITYIGSNSG